MPTTLNIKGKVLFMDGAPAPNARVRIYDKDLTNGRDKIFEETSNSAGEFSGKSGVYDDEPFDILNLDFSVKQGGRTHNGPYFHVDRNSVPIVLPWPSPGVTKSEREIIHVIALSENTPNRLLYETIEFGTKALASPFCVASYHRYSAIEGARATLENLITQLSQSAAKSDIEAVDLIFCTHGSPDEMSFTGANVSADELAQKLHTIPANQRKKFRAVFSTACFGRTHIDGWLEGGFQVASGSRGIYADSALSFPAFLAAWSAGLSFDTAVGAANASDPLRTQDNLAREWFRSQNRIASARLVDSTRVIGGNGKITINQ